MTHVISPPLDQRIVDDFFQLAQSRKTYRLAWFYGMLATFGVKAEHLRDFINQGLAKKFNAMYLNCF